MPADLRRLAEALKARLGRGGAFTACVAVLVGIAVFWEARARLARAPVSLSEAQYLQAARDLPAGYPLRFADLTMAPASRLAQSAPVGALTDQDLVMIKGARLRQPLPANGFLVWDALQLPAESRRRRREIPKGMRAYETPVPDSLAIEASDRVDVWLASDARGAGPLLLVEGATVLALRRAEQGSRALLALAPDEVALVEKALQRGKLKLSLRNPDEPTPRGPRRRARLPQRPAARRVEIWSEEP